MSDLKQTLQQTQCEIHRMTPDELLQEINKLSDRERCAITQEVLGRDHGLTVILGNTNHITNSVVIQLGSADQIAEQLKDVSPEDLSKLLSAIAVRIAQEKSSL